MAVSRKSVARAGARVSDQVTVPCGSCLGCRADQARTWAVRLVHEGEYPKRPAWFVTLTYRPEEVPQFGTLDPEHPTRFLKRFRKRYGKVSYYLCGEYGETTERPHYHMCVYGARFLDRAHLATRHNAPVFTSETLESTWGHGLVEFTGLTYAGARYVAGYVRKKVRQRDDPEHYTRVDPSTGELVQLRPEYGRMSRRPAIGRRWIEKYWSDVYPRDFVVINGRPLKPPRYYDKFMDLPDEKGGSRERREIMYHVRRQRIEDAIEISDEKLIMKEKVHRAKVALFQQRDGV